MHPDKNAPPLNPVPPVVWLLLLPIVAVEAVLSLAARRILGGQGGVGWRTGAIEDYGFSGQALNWMIDTWQFPPDLLLRFVSYPFVHWSFSHTLFAAVFILALGKFVAEVFRPWAVVAVFFGAAATGALVYGLAVDNRVPLVGAYPGVYGLIGAFTFILWARLGAVRADRARAFLLIGFLMLFQLTFGLINWIAYGSANLDFVADLAGFGTGFALSFLVSPGGWTAVLARLRQP